MMGAQQYYIDNHVTQENDQYLTDERAKVELPTILLEKLILSGVLPGNQCKCLDDTARKTLWNSLLQSSLQGEQQLCL